MEDSAPSASASVGAGEVRREDGGGDISVVVASGDLATGAFEPPPPAYWGLDPLFWCFAKLHIGAILRVVRGVSSHQQHSTHQQATGQYWICQKHGSTVAGPRLGGAAADAMAWVPRTLKTVHVVGTVVSVDAKSTRISYSIDDGTGIIVAVVWQKLSNLRLSGAAGQHVVASAVPQRMATAPNTDMVANMDSRIE